MTDHSGPETGERTYPQRDDGGPAFPAELPDMMANDGVRSYRGMSLRDWFAGQAVVAIIEFADRQGSRAYGAQQIAATAYEMADAMIEARKR